MADNQYINLASGEILPFSITNKDVYLNNKYDIKDIVNLINSSTIYPKFRIYVLYSDETIAYEIPTSDIQQGGSYSENYQDGQRRSMSFTLFNQTGKYTPNINMLWAGTRLRLDQGIENNEGVTVWFTKGIFLVTQATPSFGVGQYSVQISASDKFSLFEDKTGALDTTYEIPIGSNIEHVIKDILLYSMGNGDPFDCKPIVYHSSFKNKTTQALISKSAGDTLGSILLELATQLSAEIFYNAMGNLTILPTNETTLDVDKPLIYEFNSNRGDISGLSFSFNMNDIVNSIIVIGSSTNGGVHKAVATNNEAGSPLCAQRIGLRVGSIINDSNISTDLLAQERADYELRQQLILKSATSVSVMFNPLLSVNNLVAISDDFFELRHAKFLIQSVSCNLDYSGQMSISISNIQNLPFVVG